MQVHGADKDEGSASAWEEVSEAKEAPQVSSAGRQ